MAIELMRRPWTSGSAFGDLAREVVPLRTMMDQLFESAFTPSFWNDRALGGWSGGQFGMDVYESGDAYTIHCLLPGAKLDRVNVTVQDNVLTISGETQRPAPDGAQPLFQEIGYGQFGRRLTLGAPVEADKAEASYHDGILTVTLPKAEQARPRQIRISGNGYAHQPQRIEQAPPAPQAAVKEAEPATATA